MADEPVVHPEPTVILDPTSEDDYGKGGNQRPSWWARLIAWVESLFSD